MVFLVLIGLALVALSVRLLIHAAVLPRIKLALHLRDIEAYGFEGIDAPGSPAVRVSLAVRLAMGAESLGRLVMRAFPALPALQRRDLSAAALYDVSPETVHGYRLMAAVGLPCTVLFCAMTTGGASGMTFLIALG